VQVRCIWACEILILSLPLYNFVINTKKKGIQQKYCIPYWS
jgi:hypothetical protein